MYASLIRKLLVAVLLFVSIEHVALSSDGEYTIKAAFIYKICAYVQWPDTSFSKTSSSIVIAVQGDYLTARKLQSLLKDKSINGRKIRVVDFENTSRTSEAHIVYIQKDIVLENETITWLKTAPPILIITEHTNYPEYSMINFLMMNEHVRFQISKTRIEKAGLSVRSALLSVAVSVD